MGLPRLQFALCKPIVCPVWLAIRTLQPIIPQFIPPPSLQDLEPLRIAPSGPVFNVKQDIIIILEFPRA
jgi:hypothetical protein